MDTAMDRRCHAAGRAPALRLFAALAAAALSACTTSSPTPDQMSRTAVETAPADLQLLCANAAAQAGGVDSGNVLPIGSRRLDAKSYQVDLNVGGATTNCVIDNDGNVASVRPAGA
jgi:hypothetical protein